MLVKYTTLKPKGKFMLCIGEEGIILLYFKNNALNKRYFAKHQNSSTVSDMKACLAAHKKVPLYLVLNNTDQDYVLRYILGVNRISAYLAVKTEIENFANTYDIRSALLVEKPSQSNPNWCYLYVLSKVKNLIEYWLNVFIEIGSNFKGILMFPVEMSNIVQKILSNSAANWNIIVASTKSGGYRQLVTQNDKIVFTTLLTSTNDTLPGIIAGKIYQEIKNTVKSLSKFGFKSGDLVDLCIIVQEDIKTSLSVIDFAENSISIFTPYELNKLLKLGLAITEKDKFCDTVVLFHSFKNQPVSLFNTKKTKELYLLNALYLHSSKFFLFLILILIFINAVCVLNLSSNIHITDHLIIKEQCLNDQLIALEQGYPIKEVNEIYDFININNVLSKIEYSPLTQVQYVEKLRTSDTELRTFEWYYDEINNSIVTKLKFYLKHGTDGYRKLQNRLNSNFRTQTVNIYSPPLLEEKQDVAVYINIEEKT